MDLGDLIAPEGVIPSLKATTKKQALQELALRAAALTGVEQHVIFEALFQREQLASTGYGRGIAIPHVRLPGLPRVIALFARMEEPIAFDSVDDEPVDLIFLLLAPEHAGADHLKALARVSRLLRDPQSITKLRTCDDRDALHAMLTEPLASHAA
ncbi:MAG TPA: PTS sugar transporter subunit IIA [Hyphomicrobiaceae bacterium]|nr:PTS sugar transporter subunit IIA [Hyphomicrobiaceae bacterium]